MIKKHLSLRGVFFTKSHKGLHKACELEEQDDSNDTDHDVTDAFQLSIHGDVVENQGDNKENDKGGKSTHTKRRERGGKEEGKRRERGGKE